MAHEADDAQFEERIASLEAKATQALELARKHAQEHTDLGQDPIVQRTTTGHGHSEIRNNDGDTKIQTGEVLDDHILRFDADGVEVMTISDHGVDMHLVALEDGVHLLEMEIDAAGFGDIKAINANYETGALATGEEASVVLVGIDQIDATGGDIFAFLVLSTEGGANEVFGLGVGPIVGPIHQDSGTFANPTTGTNNTASTDVADMIDGSEGTNTTIFVADNDFIIIGAAAAFTAIEFNIETGAAQPGVQPTFGYSTSGSGQFTAFAPIDGTNGFRNTGVLSWEPDELTGHTTNDDTGTFDIKITRTHANRGSVSLFFAKTATTVVYTWDPNGDLITRFNYQREQSAAGGDTAALGQFWVKSDGPNTGYFTDDAGTDHVLHVTTTRGDIMRRGASIDERLAIGASARLLQSDGTDPSYVAVSGDATIAAGGAVTVAGTHSGSAHHTQVHGIADHTEHATWKLLYTDGSGDEQELSLPADGHVLKGTGTAAAPAFEEDIKGLVFLIDGGGSAITTGIKGVLPVPFACTITAWIIVAEQSGSINVDVNRAAFNTTPSYSSIAASAHPALVTAVAAEDTTLTGWTTTLAAKDFLQFEVDSITTVEQVSIILLVKRT